MEKGKHGAGSGDLAGWLELARRGPWPGLEGGRPSRSWTARESRCWCCGLLRDALILSRALPGFGYFYLDFFPVMTLIWMWWKWGRLQIFHGNQQPLSGDGGCAR